MQQEQPVEETPNEGEASDDNGQETSAGNEPEEPQVSDEEMEEALKELTKH